MVPVPVHRILHTYTTFHLGVPGEMLCLRRFELVDSCLRVPLVIPCIMSVKDPVHPPSTLTDAALPSIKICVGELPV